MAYFSRTPIECPHRRSIANNQVECGVLDSIVGDLRKPILVDESVCENCCNWLEPSQQDWNPVIASVILDRVEENHSCVPSSRLRQKATEAIPIAEADPSGYLPDQTAPPDVFNPRQIEDLLPLPIPIGVPARTDPLKWMIGITTSPRRRPTIRYCLDSVRRSGWADTYVFSDGSLEGGEIDTPAGMQVTRICRGTNVGGWSNFVLAAQELVHREPDADAYMMLQDDAMLARYSGLRPYVEQVMRSIGPNAVASLYCCDFDIQSKAGWHRLTQPMQRGAQGFAFGGMAMRRFVADPITRPWDGPWHNNSARPLEQRGIDGNIGRWAVVQGVPLWLPTPSLVWHLGETSTLWPGATMTGIRRAGDFLERHFPAQPARK